MNSFEQKQAIRRARLQRSADSARAASSPTYTRAKGMASAIPFGQPVLAGHHSESRDRNYRGRIEKTFRQSFELQEQADELARRASRVGSAGVSSDDPAAVEKLREKLAALEANQEQMKKANGHVRRGNRAALASMGYSGEAIEQLLKPDHLGRVTGYASYELTNNNANIRRIRARIAELDRLGSRQAVDEAGAGYQYREDTADRRVWFVFPCKPAEAIRKLLKSHGFKWSPNRSEGGRSVYVRQLSQSAINAARWLRPQLDQLCSTEDGDTNT